MNRRQFFGRFAAALAAIRVMPKPAPAPRPRTALDGVTTSVRDMQRAYNYARSQELELIARKPRAPWIIAE